MFTNKNRGKNLIKFQAADPDPHEVQDAALRRDSCCSHVPSSWCRLRRLLPDRRPQPRGFRCDVRARRAWLSMHPATWSVEGRGVQGGPSPRVCGYCSRRPQEDDSEAEGRDCFPRRLDSWSLQLVAVNSVRGAGEPRSRAGHRKALSTWVTRSFH